MSARCILLWEWADAQYGDHAPTVFTLRRWARDGNILPTPEKVGRTYFVLPEAKYVKTRVDGKPHRRLRLKDRLDGTPAKCA